MITRYRKAIAAFILPFLGLPIYDWVVGDAPFDSNAVNTALGAAVMAVIVYFVPNAAAPDVTDVGPPADTGYDPPPVAG